MRLPPYPQYINARVPTEFRNVFTYASAILPQYFVRSFCISIALSMDTGCENRVLPKPKTEQGEPYKSQFLRFRGKTPSPPLSKRVIVYDGDQKTVKVTSEKKVISSRSLRLCMFQADSCLPSEPDEYQKLKLPPRQNSVTIFVDPETKSKPTTQTTSPDGDGNVILAKLYLDRLGNWAQVLRFLGQLSTLYVKNMPPLSESSSMYGSQSIGGTEHHDEA